MPPDTQRKPDVTVVVIVYNDEQRLATAVRSVLRQTLRSLEVVIVDDCSIDATPVVARRLCDEDSRVRYLRLPDNSGGCGAPRNAGIAAARGKNLMFLDSDDRLERHACKNLLEAREDADADFSMGLVRREYMDTKRQTRWYPAFFQERRVLEGIDDWPELIEETLSVNKLYRREFIEAYDLCFPEDVHYEDQLFTIMAYHRAGRIAIIPETVYIWRIFPRGKHTSSISNQRSLLSNFHSRLAVHGRIDEYLDAHRATDLRRTKDLKFLQHDMRLYLEDSIAGDPGVTRAVLAEAEEYLRSIPTERFDELPSILRAAYGMALRHDIVGLRQVMLLDRHNLLGSEFATHEGRTYLTSPEHPEGFDPAYPADARENRFLDVDGLALLTAPFGTYHLLSEVTQATRGRRGLRVTVRTTDTLHKLRGRSDWRLSLVARRRGRTGLLRLPIEVESHIDESLVWHSVITPRSELFRFVMDAEWELRVEIQLGKRSVSTSLIWPQGVAAADLPMHLPSKLVHGSPGRIGPDARGIAQVLVVPTTTFGRRAIRAIDRRVLARWDQGSKAARARRHHFRTTRLYRALRQLPLDPQLAVFEANMGTIYGDSPKYVYESMRQLRPGLKSVWVLPTGATPPSPDVEVVQRGTIGYVRALARATYLVDNQTWPGYVRKRPGQRYLQTWHGIPLKKMGRHVDGHDLKPQRPDRGFGAWDHLVVPNDYFEKTIVEAFSFTGNLVRYGTPRNDVLVNGTVTRAEARALLDLPADARVMLYAPTFRENRQNRKRPIDVPFDVKAVIDAIGADAYLLLRPHYLNRVKVPPATRYRAINVSAIDDVNLLYLAADVLITDYSSVMFDFALLRKPMVFYTYDYDDYLATRGTYFDLRQAAPGRFAEDTEQLVSALKTADGDLEAFGPVYDKFLARYCGQEDGNASERAALALFGDDSGASS